MPSGAIGGVGRAYRKRRLRRALLEALGHYRYSTPALHDLDRKLAAHTRERLGGRSGFFIEAGANDGFDQSNTYFLARKHRWTGLLIEPVPELADHCRRIRPESTVVNAALGPPGDEGITLTLHRAGLMSTIDGALGPRQEEHLARAKGLQPGADTGDIAVPVRTLSSIIDQHAPGREIDLLSLDVEGFEPQALAGLDLDRHAPLLICVEANDPDAIDSALANRYEPLARLSHHDRLYLRAAREA